jgi:hypothetical protein
VLVVGTVRKGDLVVMKPDICGLLLDATGYARLATLEWANEVANAAKGMASVATIEPTAHSLHVWDPGSYPATSAPSWITTPSR